MLHNETVEKSTLELIISLQSKTYLNQFHLPGGSALALYLGHRKSVDIALFSNFSCGISVLSEQDIIAMKLNAISLSGTRSKDFIDIYYFLSKYSIGNMLDFYKEKYNQQNDTFILKSLIYFTDVDLADYPVLIKDPLLKWSNVKRRIEKAVLNYLHGKQVVGN
ncbi:MAG: nucleotidyl transferase AbiEii/AbiGii toxin family protein [Bacteroidota bacterium]